MTEGTETRPALFLDRDGTVIHDLNYPDDPSSVALMPGAGEALARFKREGFALVLVSNQSGVGRKLITSDDVERVHARMVELLNEQGVTLDDARYCFHAPWEGCSCRKPSPDMLLQAAAALDIDLERSYMIGDKDEDVTTGQRVGCRTILLRPEGAQQSAADLVAGSWDEIVDLVSSDAERLPGGS